MRIGIDISQTAFPGTGVSEYLEHLIEYLLKTDKENEYVLFFSSLRKTVQSSKFKVQNNKIEIKAFKIPPMILDLLWNRLHIFPIEWFIGNVDIFITSDWTEPPAIKAKKATILYDLIVYKCPEETSQKIVSVQKRKLRWVQRESQMVFCISDSTKKDAQDILEIDKEKLSVITPGL